MDRSDTAVVVVGLGIPRQTWSRHVWHSRGTREIWLGLVVRIFTIFHRWNWLASVVRHVRSDSVVFSGSECEKGRGG